MHVNDLNFALKSLDHAGGCISYILFNVFVDSFMSEVINASDKRKSIINIINSVC